MTTGEKFWLLSFIIFAQLRIADALIEVLKTGEKTIGYPLTLAMCVSGFLFIALGHRKAAEPEQRRAGGE